MFQQVKNRAASRGIKFSISLSDIQIPEFCPVLGIKLKTGVTHSRPDSPSLDRIDSSKGYIKGNVIVVSHRANTIKNNSTIEELEAVFNFYKDKWAALAVAVYDYENPEKK